MYLVAEKFVFANMQLFLPFPPTKALLLITNFQYSLHDNKSHNYNYTGWVANSTYFITWTTESHRMSNESKYLIVDQNDSSG